MSVRSPVHCIVPPFMLRNLYANTTGVRQKEALTSLLSSARLRGRREALSVGMLHSEREPGGSGKRRQVYSAGNSTSLPGRLIMNEGDPPAKDPSANEAYEGAGSTYDLFWEVYERDSLDGRGLALVSTVHYGTGYDNAFWDGNQMVYGDGDGELFNPFTSALDVIGHELAHGVTQYTSNLTYMGQSGALNESLSDVFGSLAKQRQRGEDAAAADWLVGQGLFTDRVNGVALRSMKEPGTAYDDPVLGKDPQPAHMRDYVSTLEDNGGVHINSGIPNHAFFLTAVALGGRAWDRAGRIWYVTARDRLRGNASFEEAANLLYQIAGDLYGDASDEQAAVRYGWENVGVKIGGVVEQPGTPSGCLATPIEALRGFAQRIRRTQTDQRLE